MTLLPIPGFDGYHAEPETGHIWSTLSGTPKRLAGGISKGYRIYSFLVGGKQFTRSGHRMVALTVYGPCPDGMECCHKNGNRTDNRAENLRWATAAENNGPDKLASGTLLFGERHHNSKITARDASEIRRRRALGEKLRSLASDFGISEGVVSKIALGKAWAK